MKLELIRDYLQENGLICPPVHTMGIEPFVWTSEEDPLYNFYIDSLSEATFRLEIWERYTETTHSFTDMDSAKTTYARYKAIELIIFDLADNDALKDLIDIIKDYRGH